MKLQIFTFLSFTIAKPINKPLNDREIAYQQEYF